MMRRTIRLACVSCDRQDFDGITAAELQQAIEAGWEDVAKVQSFAESCTTYENPADAPPGFSAFEWWTHLGTCPDCAKTKDKK